MYYWGRHWIRVIFFLKSLFICFCSHVFLIHNEIIVNGFHVSFDVSFGNGKVACSFRFSAVIRRIWKIPQESKNSMLPFLDINLTRWWLLLSGKNLVER